jgi:guanylate kinase
MQRGKAMVSASSFEEKDIKTIEKISCKIMSGATDDEKDIGTAVALFSSQTPDLIYIITAKHCLLGQKFDKNLKPEEIEIYFPFPNDFFQYKMNPTDRVLYSENYDFALIIISADDIKSKGIDIPEIKFLEQDFTSNPVKFRGFPRAYENNEAANIEAKYSGTNVLYTKNPLHSLNDDPISNVQGFSGSGVFFVQNKTVYLIGIVYEFRETFSHFKVQNLNPLNELLTINGLTEVYPADLPIEESLQENLEALEQHSGVLLDRIKDSIGQHQVDRQNEIQELRSHLDQNQLVIITGAAGVGKSALFKSLKSSFTKKDFQIFAFNAEYFSSPPTIFSGNYDSIFQAITKKRQILILLDSMEKILEFKDKELFKDFLRQCKGNSGIKLVITCRQYAFDSLRTDFSEELPEYLSINLPPIETDELRKIIVQYPTLNQLAQKEGIRQIIKNLFYLKLIINNIEILKENKDLTEREFKDLIWKKVISRGDQERGQYFERIAVARAFSMKLFVKIEGITEALVKALEQDELITIEPKLKESYSPSHDIYEDIALIRYIERKYQNNKLDVTTFFEQLEGDEPAKHRAFRLWLEDSLQSPTQDLKIFIKKSIEETASVSKWSESIITAILKSEYCEQFFEDNESLLLQNELSLFLTFLHMLRTACREPDPNFPEQFLQIHQISIYDETFLKPVGKGWEIVIKFIGRHFDRMGEYKLDIMEIIGILWRRKLKGNPLPPESKDAGRLLLKLLDEYSSHYKHWESNESKDKLIEDSLFTLFSLAEIFEEEVKDIIETALEIKKDGTVGCKNLRYIDLIINYTLSSPNTKPLCRQLPQFISDIAKEYWLAPPQKNKKDLKKLDEGKLKALEVMGLKSSDLIPSEMFGDLEKYNETKKLGLRSSTELKYYPPYIGNNPTYFLLNADPSIGLNLIIDVMNHATEKYYQSNKSNRENTIKIHIDNEEIIQVGDKKFWGFYRGWGYDHHLLPSIMMALERWLLDLCKRNEIEPTKEISVLIHSAYNYILRKSKSVATTAVLASVATAHPRQAAENVFPILKVKEFYDWDRERFFNERDLFIPRGYDIYAEIDREQSNNLPHRRKHLENLVFDFQIFGFKKEMFEILDKFYSEADKEDKSWRLSLNKMDLRKHKVSQGTSKHGQNIVYLEPILDNDLKEMSNVAMAELKETNDVRSISVWPCECLENKLDPTNKLEKWTEMYNKFCSYSKNPHNLSGAFFQRTELPVDPICLASLGIRDYFDKISASQKKWCVSTILNIFDEMIARNPNSDSPPSTYSMYYKYAYESLTILLGKNLSADEALRTKEAIFLYCVDHLSDGKEDFFESIRKNLWAIDDKFAESVWRGILEYASAFHKIMINSHESIRNKKFEKSKDKILKKVLRNHVDLTKNKISFQSHAPYFLKPALMMIPHDTLRKEHHEYYSQIYTLLLKKHLEFWKQSNKYNNSSINSIEIQFQYSFSHYLLEQPVSFSKKTIISFLNKAIELNNEPKNSRVERFILETFETVFIAYKNLQSDNFWDIWESLATKIKEYQLKYLVKVIFLNSTRFTIESRDFPDLQSRQSFFKSKVEEIGHFDVVSVLKLLSGIGALSLLPDGIIWIEQLLDKHKNLKEELNQPKILMHFEALIKRLDQYHSEKIRASEYLKKSLISLLDILIKKGSSAAYNIREKLLKV